MAWKHLLGKPYGFLTLTHRSISTSSHSSAPSLLVSHDQLEEALNRVENPNPKFLRYSSPHPPVVTDPIKIPSFPETRVTTLPNGLRIATESNLAAKTATISAWIDAGSRHDDTDKAGGTAHFVEHLKLNTRYWMSSQGNQDKIEDMGGYLNACTDREYTAYNLEVRDNYVPDAIHFLADILKMNTGHEDVDSLRDGILREKEAAGRCPEKLIFDHLHTAAFQFSPLGRTVFGPDHVIKTIQRKKILNFISTHYTAPRTVIAAAGAVKHEDIVEKVNKLITRLPTDPTTASQLAAKEPTIFTASEVRIIDDGLPLAHFAVAFKGASLTDPDSIALMVMQFMLGSWNKSTEVGKYTGSELAQRVAIDNIAESLMPFNKNYKDAGLFGVYACAKPDRLDDLAYAIMHEICKLSYRVSESDVIRSCNQLKSSILLELDGTTPVAEAIGSQLLAFGGRISYAELFARIDAVGVRTIKRVASRFVLDKDIAIAAVGPIQSLPEYNWFRRSTCLNRQ